MKRLGEGRTVVLFGKMAAVATQRLQEAGFTVIERPDHPGDRHEVVREADAVMVRMTAIDAELLANAPKLRIVSRHGVGYDTVDVDALSGRGIPLAVTGDVNSAAVAEHTLALMLALCKRIASYDQAVREGRFDIRDRFAATELAGRTLLLIGFGRIGRKVARLATAFDMRVLVFDPWADPAVIRQDGLTAVGDLTEGLPLADYVSIHVPRTPDTRNMLDATRLRQMRPTAHLVNVSRGGLVDEAALAEALCEGRIAGAALDTFDPEPPLEDNPLLRNENVVLSPHSAAFTQECAARMALDCADNVIDHFSGRLAPDRVINRSVLETGAETKGGQGAAVG